MIADRQESEDQLAETKIYRRFSAKQLDLNDDLFHFNLIIFLKKYTKHTDY